MYEKDRGQERPPASELTALTTICFFFVFTAWIKLCNKALDYFMPWRGNKEDIKNFEAQSSSFGTLFPFYRTFNVRFKHCSLTNLIYSSSRLLFQKKTNPLIYPLYATIPAANSKKTNYLVKNVVASIRGRHVSQELAEMKTEAKYRRWIEKQLQLDYDVALCLLDV